MAWTASGLFRPTWAQILDQTMTTLDWDAASMFKVALYDNSVTPNFSGTNEQSRYGGTGSAWLTTGGQTGTAQVYHTGQWAQGGVTLATNDITEVAGNIVRFDGDDTASGATATMSNIYGAYIYADTVTAPVADVGAVAVYFGGTAFSVTNGTFTIQWNANGIWQLTVA